MPKGQAGRNAYSGNITRQLLVILQLESFSSRRRERRLRLVLAFPFLFRLFVVAPRKLRCKRDELPGARNKYEHGASCLVQPDHLPPNGTDTEKVAM